MTLTDKRIAIAELEVSNPVSLEDALTIAAIMENSTDPLDAITEGLNHLGTCDEGQDGIAIAIDYLVAARDALLYPHTHEARMELAERLREDDQ